MNPPQFIQKWRGHALGERQAAQQHFLDLCTLVAHGTPAELDSFGEWFTFERGVEKQAGGEGWADVWKRGFFGWEYKGKHKDLKAAYAQLLQYREALENPPLLVVSDTDRIEVHTNFTNTPHKVYTLELEQLADPESLRILRALFHEPENLKPGTTSEAITAEAARRVGEIAQRLRDRGEDPHRVARFLDRMVFCLFAEDVELLPGKVFTRLVTDNRNDPHRFNGRIKELFKAMAVGGDFGADRIRYFNGNLFVEAVALDLTTEDLADLCDAARLDWGAVDPSVFGTLFERGLDPSKRSQLGAHYTSRHDIETLVEPVVMAPLRREWEDTKAKARERLAKYEADIAAAAWDQDRRKRLGGAVQKDLQGILGRFGERLAGVKILDPACGSGNFLYVALQKLLDLEKEVIVWGMEQKLPGRLPLVSPLQLHAIEINPYAFELAQMTVWIGYLQWSRANGWGEPPSPVLKPMHTFERKDAVLHLEDAPPTTLFSATTGPGVSEPEWPAVDFIIGNPPFLGNRLLRRYLGDAYVDRLFSHYGDRIPNSSDLACYWFEKARAMVEAGTCKRAGLLATQGIRGGANRTVLQRIKKSGDIFFAVSDRDWVLDGAAVHVSMVGFDDGSEKARELDGQIVSKINADLTPTSDFTMAARLAASRGRAFYSDVKAGAFDITRDQAAEMLRLPNPHGRPNSDVLLPWTNGRDVLQTPSHRWVVDFGVEMPESEAALYEAPFGYVKTHVFPERAKVARKRYREFWWLHAEPCSTMRRAIAPLARFLVTPILAKHRIFAWVPAPTLPDHQVLAIASDSDSMMGILQSRPHVSWALQLGTQLESRPRYTPTTCFETFPFPKPTPTQEAAIAAAAAELDKLRTTWLNPPEWSRAEVLEFPAAVDGPWAAYVVNPDSRGIGSARYSRIVAKDEDSIPFLKTRTMTALYNQRPAWLDSAHQALDEAVFAAYGWDPGLSDETLLERLLELNLASVVGTRNGVD